MAEELSVEDQILAAQESRSGGENVPIEHAGADLSGFQLPGADLTGANFEDADLTGAILAGAHLSRANLKGTILIGATLDGADLSDADLRGADLAGARIDDAVLAGARLEGACLHAVAGDPLSLAGARMDRVTIDSSEFTMRDIAQFVVRGVEVRENETAPVSEAMPVPVGPTGAPSILPLILRSATPPEEQRQEVPEQDSELPSSGDAVSSKKVFDPDSPTSSKRVVETFDFDRSISGMPGLENIFSSLPPVGRADELNLPETGSAGSFSIVPSARVDELRTRQEQSDAAEEIPVSQRMFQQLNALIDDARLQARPADSIRPQRKSIKQMAQSGFRFPAVGDEYLGVIIEAEMPRGTTSRCFQAKGRDGADAFVVRVFDPECEGAALQLPAFQRGLRALNRLQALGRDDLLVAELVAVAADLTAYVVRQSSGGNLQQMLDVSLSLEQGLEAISSLAKSVAVMHDQGIMVRAWKPTNVLVDGFQLVMSEPDMVHLPTLTQSRGDAGGYEAYAAPEELIGRGTRSPTADVFSLGKMLEFLLTGEEPLVPLGSPPLISQRDNIPDKLVEIVKRATEQHPTQRYARVGDLLTDLENFREHGDRAVLTASIRPEGGNRLNVPLLSSNREGDPSDVIKERLKARDAEQLEETVPEEGIDWARQFEVGIALLAGVGGFFVLAPLILAPRSIDQMEGLSVYLALALGTLVLAMPAPRTRRILYRCATWSFAASIIWLLDPLALTRVTWKERLRSGDPYEKEEAARTLSRIGEKNMRGAFLDEAQLSGARLDSVDFSGASLKSANFRGAFLVEANFEGADLTRANFSGANLAGAHLRQALGLDEARCDRHTALPSSFSCDQGYLLVDGTAGNSAASAIDGSREEDDGTGEKPEAESGEAGAGEAESGEAESGEAEGEVEVAE